MRVRPLMTVLSVLALSGLAAPVWAQDAAPNAAPVTAGQPESIPDLLTRGRELMEAGKYAEALAIHEQVTARAPQNPGGWFGLGYCLHMLGRLDEALPAHKRAAATGPAWMQADALYNIACVHALRGRTDEAFGALKHAARAGMRDSEQLEKDPDLASLRSDPRWAAHLDAVKQMKAHPPERLLLFWAGTWDCYARDGSKAGINTFEKRLGGKVLHEQWKSTGGGEGESWNVYDPSTGEWNQTWVEPSGRVTKFVGNEKDGGVWFEGRVLTTAGEGERVTMFVRPVGKGWVRQTGGAYDASGSLQPRYDLLYVPAGESVDLKTFDWGK